jgi:hypothetical protein
VAREPTHSDEDRYFGRDDKRMIIQVQPDKSYSGDLEKITLVRVSEK